MGIPRKYPFPLPMHTHRHMHTCALQNIKSQARVGLLGSWKRGWEEWGYLVV